LTHPLPDHFRLFIRHVNNSGIFHAANAAINAAIKDKALIESWATQGLVPLGGSTDDMAKDLQRQLAFWGPIVKRIGFTAES
jgi:tripartite-type tricarboxylate transporter receptor subunit TctC